jgi:hypothetical protein
MLRPEQESALSPTAHDLVLVGAWALLVFGVLLGGGGLDRLRAQTWRITSARYWAGDV